MSNRAELSTGEALVGLLEAYGVDTIFGIPGVHNIEMYRALPRSRIRHVLVRHEQGAGFMADGYARATGKPGVCFTITGPGVLNILTPMAQAWSDSSNVLVISTALDIVDSAQGRGRLHEMIDQRGAAGAVTKLALRAYTPKDVRDAIARAFANFASARPRPVYIEIPIDTLKQPAGEGWTVARGLPHLPVADAASISAAARKLNGAQKPLLILGGGSLGAGKAALAIAEKLNAPVLTTVAGKGAVPADHPLCLGYRLGRPEAVSYINKSDAILCVGSELSETDFWNTDAIIAANLIRVDIDPDSIARPHTAEIAVLGDAAASLEQLLPQIKAKGGATLAPDAEGAALRAMADGDEVIHQVLATLRKALPAETVVVSDMTQIAYAGNEVFPVLKPRTWIHPVGFGTLGFALPVGIGAKFGRPDTPVAVLHGDYGIQYTLNELGTAVEHELPVLIFVWNNERLGAIHDSMARAGIQPNNVTLRNPDFQMLAKAYACAAAKPTSLSDLEQTIATALKAKGPTLIEITPRIVHG